MKKLAILLSVVLILSLCACDKAKPDFEATVIENRESMLLVAPDEDEKLYSIADRIYVTLPDEIDVSNFNTGDKVKITYSGEVAESYPAHIAEVSSVVHITETEEKTVKIPSVMVNGKLYYSTGFESDITARCGVMDGEITSSVDSTEFPTENNQSNFGKGYSYQFIDQYSIDVFQEDTMSRYVTEEIKNGWSTDNLNAAEAAAKAYYAEKGITADNLKLTPESLPLVYGTIPKSAIEFTCTVDGHMRQITLNKNDGVWTVTDESEYKIRP